MSRGRVVTEVATCKHCGKRIMRCSSSWANLKDVHWMHEGQRSLCRIRTRAEPLGS